MLKITHAVLKNLRGNNKPSLPYAKHLKSTIAEAKNVQTADLVEEPLPRVKSVQRPHNSMVAAAFAALNPSTNFDTIRTPITDEKISKARTVDELLSISEGNGVSRRHALKVLSALAAWSSSGKALLTDFENDSRFLKLCRVLTRGPKVIRNVAAQSENVSTILNVTADDEAARLVANLTLPQIVKVMTILAQKKRRPLTLLRVLAYNIAANGERLNVKESADLLYSMCLLNYHDDNLVARVCQDISEELDNDLSKSAVVGSIVTSLGMLKYKNCEVLDALSNWVLRNHTICRPQDLSSLFITLATVNYTPSNSDELFKVLVPELSVGQAKNPTVWLNIVWSLVVLNQATAAHVSSVLAEDFVKKIEGSEELNVFTKLKLLNVNGAAVHLIKDYQGETLSPSSSIHTINMEKTKEKAEMVDNVVHTLKNLIHSENHLVTNINSGMGFYIDAKCLLDKKCNPLLVEKNNEEKSGITKISIFVYDYHNMCRGKVEPTGMNRLACRLLEAQNYKVLTVPYTEFKTTDKLVYQVKYLETKLKEIVK